MKNRSWKKFLSFLLASTMVFTMNTAVFADNNADSEKVVAVEEGTAVNKAADEETVQNASENEEDSGDYNPEIETETAETLGEATDEVSDNDTLAPQSELKTLDDEETISINQAYAGTDNRPFVLSDGTWLMVKGGKFAYGSDLTTSDKKIVSVKKGVIQAKKEGEATLSGAGGTVKVKVIVPTIEKKFTLSVGDLKDLSLNTGIDEAEEVKIDWSSSNTEVAQVYQGTVQAVGVGSATISAWLGGKAYKSKVKVTEAAGKEINMYLRSGKKRSPKGKDYKKGMQVVSGSSATVNGTKIVASSPGKTVISSGNGSKINVYVESPSYTQSLNLRVGERALLYSDNVHELPAWKSSKSTVASVSEFGVVSAETEGKSKISAKIAGQTVKVAVTVSGKADENREADESGLAIVALDPMNGNTGITVEVDDNGDVGSEIETQPDDDPVNPDTKTYTVTFDTDGGSEVPSQKVKSGEKATKPEDPKKEGFIFDGWTLDGAAFSFDSAITANITLKAVWKTSIAVTSVSLNNTAPKVGDTITATYTPSNASNIATYEWSTSDAADGNFTKVEGATAASLELDSSYVGKFVKITVTDTEGNKFEAVTTAAVTPVEGTLTASQNGANTISIVAGDYLNASDTVVVKKGSTVQDIKWAIGDDAKTATITSTSKITSDDYTVTVTPADQGKAAMTASFKGEAEKLAGLNFGKELVLVSATDFKTVQTTITGANQFGEDFNLGSGTVQVYPSVGTTATPNTITGVGTFTTGYDPAKKTYTLVKDGTIPFQIGDKVSFTAIYTSGSTVVQQTAELAVANVPYVAEMTFGEIATTNAKLKDKRINVKNFNGGTYYIPVVAKDQYGNTLTADDLNAKVAAESLFINPVMTAGAYGGFDTIEGFTTLDDGTVAMNLDGRADGTSLPGEATITVAGLGGLSTSTKYTVVDNDYIDEFTVSFPTSVYQATKAEFTVSAKNQYGEDVSLYDQDIALGGTGKVLSFGDTNTLTNQGSAISVNNGELAFEKVSSSKTVKFYYTPDVAATNDVATMTTATPKVTTQTLTVSKSGNPASIQKTLNSKIANSSLTIQKGVGVVDFQNALVFVDNNGMVIDGKTTPVVAPTKSDAILSTTANNDGTNGTENAAADTYYWNMQVKNGAVLSAGQNAVKPTVTTTYTVNLYYVETAAGKAKLLDSKDFKVVVSSKNESGNAYEDYEATIKEGDELLYNVGITAATTSTRPLVADATNIVVKGTDASGNVVTLVPGDDYTMTVDSGLVATASAPSTSTIAAAPAADGVTDPAKAVTGEATVTIYDAQSKQAVTTVKVPYSNAPEKAAKWRVTKFNSIDRANTDAVIPATGTTAVTADTIDLAYDATVDYIGAQRAFIINSVAKDLDDDSTVDDHETWVVDCVDQYGLRFAGSTGNYDGVKKADSATTSPAVMTNTSATATAKHTIQLTADGIDAFNFYVVVGVNPAEVTAANTLKTAADNAMTQAAYVTAISGGTLAGVIGANSSVADTLWAKLATKAAAIDTYATAENLTVTSIYDKADATKAEIAQTANQANGTVYVVTYNVTVKLENQTRTYTGLQVEITGA